MMHEKKHPFKVQSRPMDFNVTGCRKCLNNGFRFHIGRLFKKLTFIDTYCIISKEKKELRRPILKGY